MVVLKAFIKYIFYCFIISDLKFLAIAIFKPWFLQWISFFFSITSTEYDMLLLLDILQAYRTRRQPS